MMLKIDIKTMEEQDIPQVVFIENFCFSRPWSENAFKNTSQNDNSHFMVATSGQNIVGYIGLYSVAGEGYVYKLAVHPDFRGNKTGQSLVKSALDYSRKLDLKFLSLEVRVSNKIAIGLYKKCGFEKCGMRKNFYEFPKEDAFIMTCFLKKDIDS